MKTITGILTALCVLIMATIYASPPDGAKQIIATAMFVDAETDHHSIAMNFDQTYTPDVLPGIVQKNSNATTNLGIASKNFQEVGAVCIKPNPAITFFTGNIWGNTGKDSMQSKEVVPVRIFHFGNFYTNCFAGKNTGQPLRC